MTVVKFGAASAKEREMQHPIVDADRTLSFRADLRSGSQNRRLAYYPQFSEAEFEWRRGVVRELLDEYDPAR